MLSLGLVMGGVAVVSATTSATDANTSQTTPAAITPEVLTPASVTPAPVPKAPIKATQNNYHYSDGHSNMNPQQHQQMHVTHPSENHQAGHGSGHE